MRVISGTCKGRRLRGPEGLELRPTGDRLKESLFNILGTTVRGAVVMDAFGGTGAIGIEAISRDAEEVVFVENSASAYRLIQYNLRLCHIETRFRILQEDVFAAMRLLARQGFKMNIAFFDPPYDFKPYQDLLDIAFGRDLLSPGGLVVMEHHRKAVLPESGPGYGRTRIVRQGDHCLSFFKAADGE